MKFALLSLLFLTTPATAQSFYPHSAGARYCELRRHGVAKQEALETAMRENWASSRTPVYANTKDGRYSTDVLDMAAWAARCGG